MWLVGDFSLDETSLRSGENILSGPGDFTWLVLEFLDAAKNRSSLAGQAAFFQN